MKPTTRKAIDNKYKVGSTYKYQRGNNIAEFLVTDIRMPSLKTKTIYIYYHVTKGLIEGCNSFMRLSDFDLACSEVKNG